MKQGREMTKFDLVWRRSSPRDAKRLLFLIILNSFMLVQYQGSSSNVSEKISTLSDSFLSVEKRKGYADSLVAYNILQVSAFICFV